MASASAVSIALLLAGLPACPLRHLRRCCLHASCHLPQVLEMNQSIDHVPTSTKATWEACQTADAYLLECTEGRQSSCQPLHTKLYLLLPWQQLPAARLHPTQHSAWPAYVPA
jgi:hypothetical protein